MIHKVLPIDKERNGAQYDRHQLTSVIYVKGVEKSLQLGDWELGFIGQLEKIDLFILILLKWTSKLDLRLSSF